ncbi:MAG: hypothetical protein P8M22_04335 [Phycisphaerales bacterium]|nr:hypothetical protein [Phycisphaerales bacterium]
MGIECIRGSGGFATIVAMLLILTSAASLGNEQMRSPNGLTAQLYSDSGLLRNDTDERMVIYTDVIHQPEAAWIRLSLAGSILGDGTSIRIQSIRDGEVQTLDQTGIQQWGWTSAYFNGSSVIVELIAEPGTMNRLIVDQISWDEAQGARGGEPYCGYCEEDDREPHVDYAICRMLGTAYTCTGVIVDEESHMITAGHCMEDGTNLVCQFGVPDSNLDCTINHPPVQDQFPVITWYCSIAGIGEDWAAVVIGSNGDGDRPYDRYGVYHEMATSMPSNNTPITVTGYGDDLEECTKADTLQQSEGPLVQIASTSLKFEADVTYGSSGSPVMHAGNNRILGLATHCPCPNTATRIDHPAFVAAREILFGVLGNTCEVAVPAAIGGNSFSTEGAIDSGFGDPDDSLCPDTYLDWDESPDVWMVWQPPSSGTVSLSTCDEDSYDTSLVVYQGADCSNLIQVACNGDATDEDDCQSYYSAITDLEVSPLSTYYFRLGGWQASTGPGTLWIDHVPAPATGACCLGVTCYETPELECSDAGGTYLGSGSDCTVNPCNTPITGACCTGLGMTCEQLTQTECDDVSGDFAGTGTACLPNPCPISDPRGACCDGENCQEVTQSECDLQGGDYLGDGISCDTATCTAPCPGDFNLNGAIDVDDLLAVIGNFGTSNDLYDLDQDGVVDVDDLLQIISTFGPC